MNPVTKQPKSDEELGFLLDNVCLIGGAPSDYAMQMYRQAESELLPKLNALEKENEELKAEVERLNHELGNAAGLHNAMQKLMTPEMEIDTAQFGQDAYFIYSYAKNHQILLFYCMDYFLQDVLKGLFCSAQIP